MSFIRILFTVSFPVSCWCSPSTRGRGWGLNPLVDHAFRSSKIESQISRNYFRSQSRRRKLTLSDLVNKRARIAYVCSGVWHFQRHRNNRLWRDRASPVHFLSGQVATKLWQWIPWTLSAALQCPVNYTRESTVNLAGGLPRSYM